MAAERLSMAASCQMVELAVELLPLWCVLFVVLSYGRTQNPVSTFTPY